MTQRHRSSYHVQCRHLYAHLIAFHPILRRKRGQMEKAPSPQLNPSEYCLTIYSVRFLLAPWYIPINFWLNLCSIVSIYKADPDVLVGHDFLGSGLDVLLNRMRELKADHWSRIGRFRRTRWTNIGRQGTNLKFLNGRLLCDLSSDGAKVCRIPAQIICSNSKINI
jgi:hypothetical protein